MGKREGSSSVKRFGLTARIQIRILWERFGRVVAKRRKKRLRGKSKVACLTKVEQGRASRRTTRAKTDQEDERRGARGKREKCITSAARTDVIFIPGPGRGQRGHQRTGDE